MSRRIPSILLLLGWHCVATISSGQAQDPDFPFELSADPKPSPEEKAPSTPELFAALMEIVHLPGKEKTSEHDDQEQAFWRELSDESLASLVKVASEFPPSDQEKIARAIEAIKKIPNAEKAIWELIEDADISAGLQIDDGFSVLTQAELVRDYSLERARGILKENVDFDFNAIEPVGEGAAENNLFGFGVSTAPEDIARFRMIGLVSNSIKLLGNYGSMNDLILIERYTNARSIHIQHAAAESIRILKARNSVGSSKNRPSGELRSPDLTKSSPVVESAIPTEIAESSEFKTTPRWLLAVIAIVIMGTFFLINRAWGRRT